MFILSVLLSAAVSADAFLIGTAYGIKNVKIPWISQLIIGCMGSVFSFAAVLASGLLRVIPQPWATHITTAALVLSGTYFLIKAVCTNIKPKEQISLINLAVKSMGLKITVVRDMIDCDIDGSGVIDIKEAALLGLTLSGDVAAAGFFAFGHKAFLVLFPVLTGVFNLLCISIGNKIGRKSKTKNQNIKKFADFALPAVIFISLVAKLIFGE